MGTRREEQQMACEEVLRLARMYAPKYLREDIDEYEAFILNATELLDAAAELLNMASDELYIGRLRRAVLKCEGVTTPTYSE